MNKRLPVHSQIMSIHDVLVLESIARRLAAKYPPDWLERHGCPLYGATLAASFAAAMLLGLAWGPWWSVLIPLSMPALVLVILPRCLFGRDAGRPRWAHPLAALDVRDAELVRHLAAPQHGAAVNGARFFEIWRHARRAAGLRNS